MEAAGLRQGRSWLEERMVAQHKAHECASMTRSCRWRSGWELQFETSTTNARGQCFEAVPRQRYSMTVSPSLTAHSSDRRWSRHTRNCLKPHARVTNRILLDDVQSRPYYYEPVTSKSGRECQPISIPKNASSFRLLHSVPTTRRNECWTRCVQVSRR